MPEISLALKFILSKLFYPSLSFGLTPQYAIYNIIPWPIVLISFFGVYLAYKKKLKWLVFPLIAAGLLWLLYSVLEYRIIIEYQRAVFFASLLLVMASGFSLQKIFDYLNKKIGSKKTLYLELAIIILFLALSPFYTQRENWKKLILIDLNGAKAYPKAPANMYLTEDDLRIFSGIKGKKFLSPPWKGTVIGVATDNYPLSTKGGTITIDLNLYSMFMASGCPGKKNLAKEADYVYSPKLECPGFQGTDKSNEGFILYKVIKK